MRKACLNSSMTALREIAHVFPMVGINETSTRLAIGDAIGEIRSFTIRVYDIERYIYTHKKKMPFNPNGIINDIFNVQSYSCT